VRIAGSKSRFIAPPREVKDEDVARRQALNEMLRRVSRRPVADHAKTALLDGAGEPGRCCRRGFPASG
jgi:hypothetical protein